MIQISNRVMAIVVLTATFTTGTVVGGVSVWLLERSQRMAMFQARFPSLPPGGAFPAPVGFGTRGYVDRLATELDLTSDQRDSIQSIMDGQRRAADETLREIGPRLRAGLDSVNAQIRRLLSAEQASRFDSIMREDRRRLGGRFRPPTRFP